MLESVADPVLNKIIFKHRGEKTGNEEVDKIFANVYKNNFYKNFSSIFFMFCSIASVSINFIHDIKFNKDIQYLPVSFIYLSVLVIIALDAKNYFSNPSSPFTKKHMGDIYKLAACTCNYLLLTNDKNPTLKLMSDITNFINLSVILSTLYINYNYDKKLSKEIELIERN